MATSKRTGVLAGGGAAAALAGAAGFAIHSAHDAAPAIHSAPALIHGAPAVERLTAEVDVDDDARHVMCVAISYLDSFGGRPNASSADFVRWAAGELNTTPRHRAEEIYDKTKKLAQGDLTQLAGIYCGAH
jgi:hypothetical protein